ncbi:DUF2341 domain-containing protein [Pyrococcus kukulkanii]|uniref:DUF2341 domain-containing protein n=1 Tax=Pyrococcus kukulkanii TaxID=1609559 RepID=UPI003565A754
MKRESIIIALIAIILTQTLPIKANTPLIPITIQNPNTYPLTEFQVKIDLPQQVDDPNSVEFILPNGTRLYYWFEDKDTVWVKVPIIPAKGSVTIYMAQRDPSTPNPHNDPTKVFIVYNDFEQYSSTQDLLNDGWVVKDAEIELRVFDGKKCLYHNPGVETWWFHYAVWTKAPVYATKFIVEARIYDFASNWEGSYTGSTAGGVVFLWKDDGDWIGVENHGYAKVRGPVNGDGHAVLHGYSAPIRVWRVEKVIVDAENWRVQVWEDDKLYYGGWIPLDKWPKWSPPYYVGVNNHRQYGPTCVDWIRVRKYADREPVVTVGTPVNPPQLVVVPSPSTATVTLDGTDTRVGTATFQVLPGTHTVVATAEHYRPTTTTVHVMDSTTVYIPLELTTYTLHVIGVEGGGTTTIIRTSFTGPALSTLTTTLSAKYFSPTTLTYVFTEDHTTTVTLTRRSAYLVLVVTHSAVETSTVRGKYGLPVTVSISKEGFSPTTVVATLSRPTITESVTLRRILVPYTILGTDADVGTTVFRTEGSALWGVPTGVTVSAESYSPETITVSITAPTTITVPLTKTLILLVVTGVDYDSASPATTITTTLMRGVNTVVLSVPSYYPDTFTLTATADTFTTRTITRSVTLATVEVTAPRGSATIYYSGTGYRFSKTTVITITVTRGDTPVLSVEGDYIYPTSFTVGFGGVYSVRLENGVKVGVVTVREETPAGVITSFLYKAVGTIKLVAVCIVTAWVFLGVIRVASGKAEGKTAVRRALVGVLLLTLLWKVIDFIVGS